MSHILIGVLFQARYMSLVFGGTFFFVCFLLLSTAQSKCRAQIGWY